MDSLHEPEWHGIGARATGNQQKYICSQILAKYRQSLKSLPTHSAINFRSFLVTVQHAEAKKIVDGLETTNY
ncbi:MAG TPA: hypothetical protein VFI73_08595 [Candidatus Nitrosopolaris sp.]|nr:hypothetical protein [Candidatus Nitrosopolaris sp.]